MKNILIAMALAAALPATATSASIEFEGTKVRISNSAPNAEVAIFGVGLATNGFDSVVYRKQTVATAGHDGQVVFDTGARIPCKTIWIAANTLSGDFTLSAPAPCSVRTIDLDRRTIRKGTSGVVDTITLQSPFVDLLYVVPGRGVYTLAAVDGTNSDSDAKNDGYTSVGLASAKLIRGVDGPRALQPGATLVLVDSYNMKVAAVKLDAAMLQVQP